MEVGRAYLSLVVMLLSTLSLVSYHPPTTQFKWQQRPVSVLDHTVMPSQMRHTQVSDIRQNDLLFIISLHVGVYLSLSGRVIPNHGYVAISDIGTAGDDTALL